MPGLTTDITPLVDGRVGLIFSIGVASDQRLHRMVRELLPKTDFYISDGPLNSVASRMYGAVCRPEAWIAVLRAMVAGGVGAADLVRDFEKEYAAAKSEGKPETLDSFMQKIAQRWPNVVKFEDDTKTVEVPPEPSEALHKLKELYEEWALHQITDRSRCGTSAEVLGQALAEAFYQVAKVAQKIDTRGELFGLACGKCPDCEKERIGALYVKDASGDYNLAIRDDEDHGLQKLAEGFPFLNWKEIRELEKRPKQQAMSNRWLFVLIDPAGAHTRFVDLHRDTSGPAQ